MLHAARLACLLALTSLAACQTARMKVDPTLADDRLSVKRPGLFETGALRFGDYAAADIDRSWTHSRSSTIGHREDRRSKQTYRFVFAARGAVTDRVRCETVYAEHAMQVGRLRLDDGRHGLGCVVEAADGRPRGELVMTEQDRHRPAGRMYHDGAMIDLVPTARLEGARWDAGEAVGYELRVDGALVGAVQTINGGAVWIDRSAPGPLQESAALAAATLLLYQEIE